MEHVVKHDAKYALSFFSLINILQVLLQIFSSISVTGSTAILRWDCEEDGFSRVDSLYVGLNAFFFLALTSLLLVAGSLCVSCNTRNEDIIALWNALSILLV